MERSTRFLVLLFFAITFLAKLLIVYSTDGGFDVALADLPKTLTFIEGANPYSYSSWAAPYPPFYFLFLSGILLAGSGFNIAGSTAELIFTLRLAALLFDITTGAIIYLTLKRKNMDNLQALAITSLYFLLSVHSQTWFLGDTFGFFLVALAVLFFVSKRYSFGILFLGLSVIFKIHPFLALIPVVIWFYQRKIDPKKNAAILGLTIVLGLIIPVLLVPYALDALIGFNASTAPLYTYSLFNLGYTILPIFFQYDTPLPLINSLWIISTLGLAAFVSHKAWKHHQRLELADVLVLGLVAWMLPLRQVHSYYPIWYTIPYLMKSSLHQSLPIFALQALAAILSPLGWTDFIGLHTPPTPSSALIFFTIAILYAISGVLALIFTLQPHLTSAKCMHAHKPRPFPSLSLLHSLSCSHLLSPRNIMV